jgi:hypothetical protein
MSVRPVGNYHYHVFRVYRTTTNNAVTFRSLEAFPGQWSNPVTLSPCGHRKRISQLHRGCECEEGEGHADLCCLPAAEARWESECC